MFVVLRDVYVLVAIAIRLSHAALQPCPLALSNQPLPQEQLQGGVSSAKAGQLTAHQTKLPWREESGGAATLSGLGKQGAGGLKGMMEMDEGKEGGAGGMKENVYEFVTSSQGSASLGSKGEGKEEARQQGKRGKEEEGEEGKQRMKWKEECIGAGRGHDVRGASMEKMTGEVAGSRGRGAATQDDRKSPPSDRAVEPPCPTPSSGEGKQGKAETVPPAPAPLPPVHKEETHSVSVKGVVMSPSRPLAASTLSCRPAANMHCRHLTANMPSSPLAASAPPRLAASTPSLVNPSISDLGGEESGDMVDSGPPQAQVLQLEGREAGAGAKKRKKHLDVGVLDCSGSSILDLSSCSEPRSPETKKPKLSQVLFICP